MTVKTTRVVTALVLLAGCPLLLAGCSEPSASAGAPASPPPVVLTAPAQLAARAALAQDQFYAATYSYAPAGGGRGGTVRVQRTRVGFLIELAAPADGSTVEHSTTIVDHPAGDYYCRATAAGGGCVPRKKVAAAVDDVEPARLEQAFTHWLRTLADHSAPLSIAAAGAPTGASGTCFSVAGVAASLDPPVDPGVYCFDDAGRITALRLAGGTLVNTGFAAAPATVALPAPVASALPSTAVPPPPSPSGSGAPR